MQFGCLTIELVLLFWPGGWMDGFEFEFIDIVISSNTYKILKKLYLPENLKLQPMSVQ